MPQINVNCPYCNDEHTVEIENQSDGDIEEIDCKCGKSFDVEISFSVDGIVHKKDTLSEKEVGIKCKNGCDPMKLFEIGNNQFECKECNEVSTLSELNEEVKNEE